MLHLSPQLCLKKNYLLKSQFSKGGKHLASLKKERVPNVDITVAFSLISTSYWYCVLISGFKFL